MWQRLTERSRRVMFRAQEEARKFDDDTVSAEHLLLAVTRDADSVAGRILERMGVSRGRILGELERHIPRGTGMLEGEIQLTSSAQRVIDLAYEEAQQLSNNYIGTEHLLLGSIREGMDNYRGVNGRVLMNAGVELERTRREVLALQDNDSGIKPADKTNNPPTNAAQALSSSRIAGKIFNREYQALSPQQQMMMQTIGLPMSELSPMMREMLRFTIQTTQSETDDNVQTIRHAGEIMHVRVEALPDGIRYHVTNDVTLLTTMLVREDAP